MKRDITQFKERFQRWKKTGELPYEAGRIKNADSDREELVYEDSLSLSALPAYEGGKDGTILNHDYANDVFTGAKLFDGQDIVVTGSKKNIKRSYMHPWKTIDRVRQEAFDDEILRRRQELAALGMSNTLYNLYKNDLSKPLSPVDPVGEFVVSAVALDPVFKYLGNKFISSGVKRNPLYWSDLDWDKMYMKAVKSGNIKEAQRLRDLHFQANTPGNLAVDITGAPTKTYHVVADEYDPNFNVFNPDIEGTHSAIYTSSDPFMSGSYSRKITSEAERDNIIETTRLRKLDQLSRRYNLDDFIKKLIALYSDIKKARKQILEDHPWVNSKTEPSRIKSLYVYLKKPVMVDAYGNAWSDMPLSQLPEDVYKNIKVDLRDNLLNGSYTTRSLEHAQMATGNYDGSIIKNVRDYGGSKVYGYWEPGNVYLINSNKSLKLSDAITYDDAGNIIPLSKRDNFKLNDLRYAIAPLLFGVGTGAHIGITK